MQLGGLARSSSELRDRSLRTTPVAMLTLEALPLAPLLLVCSLHRSSPCCAQSCLFVSTCTRRACARLEWARLEWARLEWA
eukprot:2878338-Pleurochrysis_carterae.AAC.2